MKSVSLQTSSSNRHALLGLCFLLSATSFSTAQSQILKLKGPEDKVFSKGTSLIFQCDPRLLDCQKDLVTLQQLSTKYPTINFWHVHSKIQDKNLKRTKNFNYALPARGGVFASTDKRAYHDEANYSLISFIVKNKFYHQNAKISILRVMTERITDQLDYYANLKSD